MGVADILSRKRRVNDWIDEVGNVAAFQQALKNDDAMTAFEQMAEKIFLNAGHETSEELGAHGRVREFCETYFEALHRNDQVAIMSRAIAQAQQAKAKK